MLNTQTSILQYASKLSPEAFAYFMQICTKKDFTFILSPARSRKLGDFKSLGHKPVSISINDDLDPDFFLFVLLHEWAHYTNFEKHQRKVAPHGIEWKMDYQKFLYEALDKNLFSEKMAKGVREYAQNPKANLATSAYLMRLLKKEENKAQEIEINQLKPGDEFSFEAKLFKMIGPRVKGFECFELEQKLLYNFGNSNLVRCLTQATSGQINAFFSLKNLLPNEVFVFENQHFKTIKKQHSKYLCLSLDKKTEYLIKADVLVQLLEARPHSKTADLLFLENLTLGQKFIFDNKRFQSVKKEGQNYFCKDLETQNCFLIAPKTLVEQLE